MNENTPDTQALPMPQTGGSWVRLPDGRLVREGEEANTALPDAATPAADDAAAGEPA